MTDFGDEDPYLGQMKGVISGIAPNVNIIDLCNKVPKHNILVASAFLKSSVRFFPKGSIFVVVVDPQVGTDRRPIVLKTYDRFFVGPDNGFVTGIIDGNSRWEVVQIHNPKYMLLDVSATFHGRDIFAPIAAHIANGVQLSSFGPKIETLTRLIIQKPEQKGDTVHGVITHVDHFGNAWTNITKEILEQLGWLGDSKGILTTVSTIRIRGIRRTYQDGESGKPMVLINSLNFVEIALPCDSASEKMHLVEGIPVEIRRLV
jgi:S-adenosyl-L-methionine hydrolase (adenosine-forming)